MTAEATTVTKLVELLAAIRGFADPRKAADQWKQAYRLLQKTDLPPARVTGVVGMRDAAGLAALIDQLQAPPAAPAEVPPEDVCRKALVAFRKRLALTTLDEQSKLGRGPLSKGAGTDVPAVVPPSEWPQPVWGELARKGWIRCIGHGLYELGKQP